MWIFYMVAIFLQDPTAQMTQYPQGRPTFPAEDGQSCYQNRRVLQLEVGQGAQGTFCILDDETMRLYPPVKLQAYIACLLSETVYHVWQSRQGSALRSKVFRPV